MAGEAGHRMFLPLLRRAMTAPLPVQCETDDARNAAGDFDCTDVLLSASGLRKLAQGDANVRVSDHRPLRGTCCKQDPLLHFELTEGVARLIGIALVWRCLHDHSTNHKVLFVCFSAW